MSVPALMIDGDETHAAFNQSSSQQTTLAHGSGAITLPCLQGFFFQSKRGCGFRRRDHPQCLFQSRLRLLTIRQMT